MELYDIFFISFIECLMHNVLERPSKLLISNLQSIRSIVTELGLGVFFEIVRKKFIRVFISIVYSCCQLVRCLSLDVWDEIQIKILVLVFFSVQNHIIRMHEQCKHGISLATFEWHSIQWSPRVIMKFVFIVTIELLTLQIEFCYWHYFRFSSMSLHVVFVNLNTAIS